MLNLKKIAVTGGIGAGKSTVCHILKDHGASTLNSDALIHQLLSENKACIHQVIQLLGPNVRENGKIDRKKVADIVFNDDQKLSALEAILHPLLLEQIEKECESIRAKGTCKHFVVELPLVQEIGKAEDFDVIVAVISDQKTALKRFIQLGFREDTFHKRSLRQWNSEKKAKNADYVIENNGTVEELNQKVLRMLKEIDSR